MRVLVITTDVSVQEAARSGFPNTWEVVVRENWRDALDECGDAELMIVDQLATLEAPHQSAGYESFAKAKLQHTSAVSTPLALIAVPDDYELDYYVGIPDFAIALIKRPVDEDVFRRAATWV